MSSGGTGAEDSNPSPEEDAHQPAKLEEILDRYLEELAAGKQPDQQAYLAAHPDLAEALRGVFRTLEFVEASSEAMVPARLEAGSRLGEFRIVREIARGGMGIVYEAIQTPLERRVALKILPAAALLQGHALERFQREAATAAKLHHTHIVPVYSVGEEQGLHYYAMQYIEGRSLAEHLEQMRESGAPADAAHCRRAARWGMEVAEALVCSHAQGTIHRDIKPSNLLLDEREEVWVSDFGLARTEAQATITATGDVVGTARYMSPEQARGGHALVDERSDLYSLGTTLYELLTLQPAFDGESRDEVLQRIATATVRRMRSLNPAIPRALEIIVEKCMEREPERRYAGAAELAADLRRVLAGEPIHARRPSTLTRILRGMRRHRLRIGAALALAGTLAAGTWLVLEQRRAEGRRRLEEAFRMVLFERDYARASELLEEARTRGVDTPELHLCRALIPLQSGRIEEALALFDDLLRSRPGYVEARLARALALFQSGDYNRGKGALDSVAPTEIHTALGWLLHGDALSITQRTRAIESFDRATRLEPDFTPAIAARGYYRGHRLLMEGVREELEPLLEDCNALVVFRPSSSYSYAVRAYGFLCAGAYAATQEDLRDERESYLQRCRRDIERAVELGRPDDSFPLIQQGIYRRFTGDYPGAIAAFERARAAEARAPSGSDVKIVHKHSMVLYATGAIQAALDEVVPACSALPDFYPLFLERALLLAELGRIEAARAVCRDLARRQEAHANALFLTAMMLELLGDAGESHSLLSAFARQDSARITYESTATRSYELTLDFLFGRLGGDEALAALAGRPGSRCELAFLIALRELGRGQRRSGLERLQTCVDTGIFRFLEHRFAQIMLARSQADPGWPRWVGKKR